MKTIRITITVEWKKVHNPMMLSKFTTLSAEIKKTHTKGTVSETQLEHQISHSALRTISNQMFSLSDLITMILEVSPPSSQSNLKAPNFQWLRNKNFKNSTNKNSKASMQGECSHSRIFKKKNQLSKGKCSVRDLFQYLLLFITLIYGSVVINRRSQLRILHHLTFQGLQPHLITISSPVFWDQILLQVNLNIQTITSKSPKKFITAKLLNHHYPLKWQNLNLKILKKN